MNVSMIHWHIEVSSICTLKCPRCPRAEVPETLLNRQLDLAFFQEQFGADIIRQAKKISFCGNDGDPIYCKEFLEICGWIKFINPSIQLLIVTNGSYKTTEWWFRLANILNGNDEIHWSLDGWDQESNKQYRINCNWYSITNGIGVFKEYNNKTYTTIATIAFRFNQKNLDNIVNIAKTYDIDAWQLTKSTKFGSTYPDVYGEYDELEPTDYKLIATSERFEREITRLSSKTPPSEALAEIFIDKANEVLNSTEYPALCYVGTKGLFLKANGELYPCCWTANRYEHNKKIIALAETRFNLYQRTLTEILQDEWWSGEFKQFDNLECKTKCTREKLSNTTYVTEW